MYTRKTRRTLKDQTIKDSFMFEAVMTDGDNCKELLEMVLGRRLTEISVSKEHSIDNNPDYKASRLDIFASDEEGTRYNIEMQVATEHTELRSRYYHSQMDMDILLAGTDYEYLPESYVIFICDYDPLGYNKYIYTMNTHCEELPELKYRDGVHTIFLSTKGNNTTEVPEEIIKFLRYVSAGLKESEQDFGSDFVTKSLPKSCSDSFKPALTYLRNLIISSGTSVVLFPLVLKNIVCTPSLYFNSGNSSQ